MGSMDSAQARKLTRGSFVGGVLSSRHVVHPDGVRPAAVRQQNAP